jgi:hypothetical protein
VGRNDAESEEAKWVGDSYDDPRGFYFAVPPSLDVKTIS